MVAVAIETARSDLAAALEKVGFVIDGRGSAIRVVERGAYLVAFADGLEPLLLSVAISASDFAAAMQMFAAMHKQMLRTAAIAHDSKNLLVPIMAAIGELADAALANEATALCARIGALLGRLIPSLSGSGANETDLGALVETLRHELDVLAGPCELITQLALTPPIAIDALDAERALANLITNARDANAKHVHVVVDVVDENVRLTIEDDGAGMDAATLARAREPFFTTKSASRGSGLGLAIVERFVSQARGTLTLESTPGAGTRVRLAWPVNARASGSCPSRRGTPA